MQRAHVPVHVLPPTVLLLDLGKTFRVVLDLLAFACSKAPKSHHGCHLVGLGIVRVARQGGIFARGITLELPCVLSASRTRALRALFSGAWPAITMRVSAIATPVAPAAVSLPIVITIPVTLTGTISPAPGPVPSVAVAPRMSALVLARPIVVIPGPGPPVIGPPILAAISSLRITGI